jgi:hypothetical protein
VHASATAGSAITPCRDAPPRTFGAGYAALVIVLVAALLSACGPRREAEEVNLVNALGRLTNTAVFAESPRGRMEMISSYDRTGGNDDWGKLDNVRSDGLAPIADLKGPGIVHRTWNAGLGHDQKMLFFFDGESHPRLTCAWKSESGADPAMIFFGEGDAFSLPLCGRLSSGCFSYLPMPFEKSLAIAVSVPADKGHRTYYQVNYELFDGGTKVESFPRVLSVEQKRAMDGVLRHWREPSWAAVESLRRCDGAARLSLAPGERKDVLGLRGPAVLDTLGLRLEMPAEATGLTRMRMLRLLVLRMYWDDVATASVEVPLGDFFMNADGGRRYASLPLAYDGKTYACRFPMPFAKSARCEIANEGNVAVGVEAVWRTEPVPLNAPRNYFHAAWSSATASGAPFCVLRAQGPGHLAGCFLKVIGTDGTWNILEGDEMMWVDGELSPSFHGTGLEDYFNAGWYYNGLFDLPLHGLLRKAAMRTSQYRLHLPDRIPFQKGLLFNFEFGHGNASQGYMSGVAYWYQASPRPASSRLLPPPDARFPPPDRFEIATVLDDLFELERIGRLEEARDVSAGMAEKFQGNPDGQMLAVRALAYREWLEGYEAVSNKYAAAAAKWPGSPAAEQARHLMWVHEAGTNAVLAHHINGRFRLYLDGRKVAEGDNPFHLRSVPVTLSPGEHEVALETAPTRPDAWVFLALRTGATNLVLSAAQGWQYARKAPARWPDTDDASVEWHATSPGGLFPFMGGWQFAPNAFVMTQSDRWIHRLWPNWHNTPNTTTYLRKKFVMPEP